MTAYEIEDEYPDDMDIMSVTMKPVAPPPEPKPKRKPKTKAVAPKPAEDQGFQFVVSEYNMTTLDYLLSPYRNRLVRVVVIPVEE